MDTKEIIYNTLKAAEAPLKSGDIAEKCGIEKKEVDKVIKSLVKDSKVSSPKRCYYQASE